MDFRHATLIVLGERCLAAIANLNYSKSYREIGVCANQCSTDNQKAVARCRKQQGKVVLVYTLSSFDFQSHAKLDFIKLIKAAQTLTSVLYKSTIVIHKLSVRTQRAVTHVLATKVSLAMAKLVSMLMSVTLEYTRVMVLQLVPTHTDHSNVSAIVGTKEMA